MDEEQVVSTGQHEVPPTDGRDGHTQRHTDEHAQRIAGEYRDGPADGHSNGQPTGEPNVHTAALSADETDADQMNTDDELAEPASLRDYLPGFPSLTLGALLP